MRWIAWGMMLNEERFCRESLLSVLDFVEEVHICEGSTAYSYFCSPYGLSTDLSAELIRSLPGYGTKLFLHQVGWCPSKRQLRNMSKKACLPTLQRSKPGETCILVLDLDEVWDPKDLQRADERFSSDPTLQYIHCDLIQLRGDFEHYRDMTEGSQEHGLYNEQATKEEIICRNGITLRQGRTAERLFRWQDGMHYVSHVTVCDKFNRYIYIDPAYRDGRECDFDIKFWHANYLKPFEQVFAKFCYFGQQDGGFKRNSPEMVERALGEGYIRYLLTGTHPKGAWAVSPLPEHLKHPPGLAAHPDRHLSEREISDPSGRWIKPGGPSMDEVMAMLKDASKFTGPDLRSLVV